MPDGEKPVIPPPPAIHIERTLALFKPDAIHKSDEIEEIILQHGFTILQVLYRYVALFSERELHMKLDFFSIHL